MSFRKGGDSMYFRKLITPSMFVAGGGGERERKKGNLETIIKILNNILTRHLYLKRFK